MRKRVIITIGISLVIVIVGILIFRIIAKNQQSARPAFQRELSVGTVSLAKQKLDKTLTFRGIIEGDPQVKVYPQAGGKLLANDVQEGSMVTVDQPIVSIDRDLVGQSFQPAIVRAPITGMVTKLYFLDRGDPIGMDKPVAEIANTLSIKVVLNVGEEDLANVKSGMECSISPVYDPKTIVYGTVFSITPFVDSDTLSGNIVLKARNKDGALKVGVSVNATIKTGSTEAYLIPAGAILMEYDTSYIFINDHGIAKRIAVAQGYNNGSLVEISGALSDGMDVVNEGSFKLFEGAKIASSDRGNTSTTDKKKDTSQPGDKRPGTNNSLKSQDK